MDPRVREGPRPVTGIERRTFLRGAGIVTVLVAGGAVWRAYDRGVLSAGTGPAYEPWHDWQTPGEGGPLSLVRAAILAANAMNEQPWLFKVAESSIALYADPTRRSGAFDPYGRELCISLGCALENLVVAAAATGYLARVAAAPGALAEVTAARDPLLAAHVALTRGEPHPSELYDAIPHRHTNRSSYDPGRALPADFVEALAGLGGRADRDARLFVLTADAERQAAATAIADAARELSRHPEVLAPSARWSRDWRSVAQQRDGVTIDDFEPPLTAAAIKFLPAWLLRLVSSPPAANGYLDLLSTARLFGVIAVRDRYERAQSLAAGRLWQRAHLLATARGVAARPANQAVQLMDQERVWGRPPHVGDALAKLTGDETWQPTFMFYMGYPTWQAHPTARRPVEDVVMRAS